jgi:uncharacterized protein YecT (DUF1311 family)
MLNDDYSPDWSKLEQDYQILTELHRTPDSRTYLGRHLGLNRDVTITVNRDASGANSALGEFASDAQLLAKSRHSNVVPVIEGRWLDPETFAIVHARVRGSTLDQLVGAFGPMPLPRVASTLDSVQSALEWARKNGVVNRSVIPENVVVQQGSERVLLAFSPQANPVDTADRCADARTIGRLAWQMLSGLSADAAKRESLAELRPDLSPRIVEETNAMMNCRRDGAVPDVGAFITLLAGGIKASAPVKTLQRGPSVVLPRDKATAPAGTSDDAVVVVNRGFSFNTRLALAAAVVAIIVLMAVLLLRRTSPNQSMTAGNTPVTDTAMQAAGDVALRARPVDTSATVISPAQPVPQQMPAPVAQAPAAQAPVKVPPTAMPIIPPTTTGSPIEPPATRRSEPPRTTQPPLTLPTTTRPADSAATPPKSSSDDVCSSTDASDQHTCLMTAIERNDVELNSAYRRLIAALRRQANVDQGDSDPQTVVDLREAQRKWVDERDTACRDVGDGPLYARARSECFAQQSAKRTRELQRMLADIPGGGH